MKIPSTSETGLEGVKLDPTQNPPSQGLISVELHYAMQAVNEELNQKSCPDVMPVNCNNVQHVKISVKVERVAFISRL